MDPQARLHSILFRTDCFNESSLEPGNVLIDSPIDCLTKFNAGTKHQHVAPKTTELSIIKNPNNGVFNNLVAGAGFEPTTFGL
ncbi:protein of unknown function [Legionella micdadei]|uniref:Uncharacterized protein n=1 Tax=Legionella micdadei TaxID=451 RepID=A0A098GCB5_LEGMI|nr:hypothetical protein Lmic_0580 [Legionella micdadei]CEG59610.1 protein of unknown function [Legionella micdadei]